MAHVFVNDMKGNVHFSQEMNLKMCYQTPLFLFGDEGIELR